MFTKENNSGSKLYFGKLLRKMKKDPEKGLNEFYQVYGKLIFRTAKNICGSYDIANEVVNQVLVKIWKLISNNPQINNPNGFIYVITSNCAKDFLKVRKEVELNEAIAVGEDNIQNIVDKDAFESYISFLTEYEQSIMIRRFVSQETFKEMAEDDGKPLSTITTTYYRCLEKIEINVLKNKKIRKI